MSASTARKAIPPAALCLTFLLLAGVIPASAHASSSSQDVPAGPLQFEVSFASEVHPGPISARVYVMLGPAGARSPAAEEIDWFHPEPFFAVEARDWHAGEPLRFGPESTGFPFSSLRDLPDGPYLAQAVIRFNPDTHRLGNGPGNAVSDTLRFRHDHGNGNGKNSGTSGVLSLVVDRVVPPRRFQENPGLRFFEITSKLLSEFHGRPIQHRAAAVLPPEAAAQGAAANGKRWPAVYIVPGFGGDSFLAADIAAGREDEPGADFIRIVLDPDCGTGHHVFADSQNNGPRATALLQELIPRLESALPIIPRPQARLLSGHSSGGWSVLWLQVNYPEFFGGAWATSPDPVDFRDFQRVDLYAPDANLFRDSSGRRRPIARRGSTPVLWFDDFSRMEQTIGPGGQLGSFEAVFSPRGNNGQPLPLFDRHTGAIDPEVAKAWSHYDIRAILKQNWTNLGPKLAGKLHVYVGSADTFYLEGAAVLLKEELTRLGSDAVVEIFPGLNHGSIRNTAVLERIDREMSRAAGLILSPDLAPSPPPPRHTSVPVQSHAPGPGQGRD